VLSKDSLRRKNFKPDDFFVSSTANKMGFVNYPPKSNELNIITCLMSTADMMQEIRDLLGKPVIINSAYRSKKVNDAVGSKDYSQHRQGLACDFVSPKFGTPLEIMKFLHSKGFIADQCLMEGSWLHISRKLSKEVMGKNPNRMMYGTFLPNSKGRRVFKAI